MFPLHRSSSYFAYTYESDEDEDEEEDCCVQLCGGCCHDGRNEHENENEPGGPLCVDETTRLVPTTTVASRERKASAVRRKSKQSKKKQRLATDPRLVGTIAVVVSMLVFCCEYYLLRNRLSGDGDPMAAIDTDEIALFPVIPLVVVANPKQNTSYTANAAVQTTTNTTSSTEYGEVWLIRHGEKDETITSSPRPLGSGCSETEIAKMQQQQQQQQQQQHTIRTMYELSPEGWDRAHHLSSLVERGDWPRFSALFASSPATPREALEAYPGFARDATGQSMVRREYQTLVPISEYLQTTFRRNSNNDNDSNSNSINDTIIRAQFTKGEVEAAALEIAKTAVASAVALRGKSQNEHTPGSANNYGTSQALNSAVVLVSWDHCSLPTLVVKGFGCQSSSSSNSNSSDLQQKDPRCYRCWSDDRFGDVMKLNVSLVTTTTTTTTTTNTASEASVVKSQTAKIVSHDYQVSSSILAMTGEAYSADRYYTDGSSSSNNNNNNPSNGAITTGERLFAVTPMSIEKSTPCTPSYCTKRPASKHLVRCSCWDE